jgi:hypothetical protein
LAEAVSAVISILGMQPCEVFSLWNYFHEKNTLVLVYQFLIF